MKQIELLTGNPGSVTSNALKLRDSNPNWTPGEFGAAVTSKGSVSVALGMSLSDKPGPRFSDLTVVTGTEKTVKKKVADLLASHPSWEVHKIAPYFNKSGTASLAVLLVQSIA